MKTTDWLLNQITLTARYPELCKFYRKVLDLTSTQSSPKGTLKKKLFQCLCLTQHIFFFTFIVSCASATEKYEESDAAVKLPHEVFAGLKRSDGQLGKIKIILPDEHVLERCFNRFNSSALQPPELQQKLK